MSLSEFFEVGGQSNPKRQRGRALQATRTQSFVKRSPSLTLRVSGLDQDVSQDVAMHVGKSKSATLVKKSELRVVDPEQLQDGRL